MERKTIKRKPLGILTADWHLREDKPVCRTDNFEKAQWNKVDHVSELQKKYDCPVYHAGDLFHHWKPSPYLLSEAIKHLPDKFYTVYGQHDLPQHNLDLAYKSGVNTLEEAGVLTILDGWHWNQIPEDGDMASDYINLDEGKYEQYTYIDHEGDKINPFAGCENIKDILVWHHMVVSPGDPLKKFVEDSDIAQKILCKYNYALIVTGDNHKSFFMEQNGRFLVNPGSLTRQTADQINHKPSVYLWYGDKVERVYLPIEEDVISREHIEVQEQRDSRIDAFISKLNSDWDIGTSFEQNLEEFFKANQTKDKVKQIVYKAIE